METETLKERLSHSLSLYDLTDDDAGILRDCFLQNNRIDSCAWKLKMSKDEVRLWYLRMTLWQTQYEMNLPSNDPGIPYNNDV